MRRSKKFIDIPLITLDKLVAKLSLPFVDFIKIDIEGSEYQALLGAKNVLESYNVKLAIAAYHDDEIRRKCKYFLIELGYNVLEKQGFLYASKPHARSSIARAKLISRVKKEDFID